MIRVLLVDDEALVRDGLRLILETTDDIEVTGEAGSGDAAISEATRFKPDVVVMDIRMPGTDEIETTRRLLGDSRVPTRVLILTTYYSDRNVYEALRAGASGFMLKDAPRAELLRAIRTVADGDSLLAPAITQRLIATFARRPPPGGATASELGGLTPRRDLRSPLPQSNDSQIARRQAPVPRARKARCPEAASRRSFALGSCPLAAPRSPQSPLRQAHRGWA